MICILATTKVPDSLVTQHVHTYVRVYILKWSDIGPSAAMLRNCLQVQHVLKAQSKTLWHADLWQFEGFAEPWLIYSNERCHVCVWTPDQVRTLNCIRILHFEPYYYSVNPHRFKGPVWPWYGFTSVPCCCRVREHFIIDTMQVRFHTATMAKMVVA